MHAGICATWPLEVFSIPAKHLLLQSQRLGQQLVGVDRWCWSGRLASVCVCVGEREREKVCVCVLLKNNREHKWRKLAGISSSSNILPRLPGKWCSSSVTVTSRQCYPSHTDLYRRPTAKPPCDRDCNFNSDFQTGLCVLFFKLKKKKLTYLTVSRSASFCLFLSNHIFFVCFCKWLPLSDHTLPLLLHWGKIKYFVERMSRCYVIKCKLWDEKTTYGFLTGWVFFQNTALAL